MPPPDASVAPTHPDGAQLVVAPLHGRPVDPDWVGAARSIGTDWRARSASGRNCTHSVVTRVERRTGLGAPALSAANLSWSKRVNIRLCYAPSSTGVYGTEAFGETCPTLSAMGPSSEGAADGRDFSWRDSGKRGVAELVLTPTVL